MQALALKYRPKNFGELIGQEAVSKSLTHALEGGRISHAYLFSGLRGSGKTSSARIFSKALVCEHGPTPNPCETCAHCQMANESRHMDIIEMDAASHRKIDDIRELIEQTKYAPAAARFKIFIIDEVHMLTKEAFNALLKTLEEPPAYVKFILATTDPLKLPATVLSRTQHFRFKQISRTNIIKHLEFILSKEGVSYEREALEILARSGSGSLRDTITLLDQAIIYGTDKVTKNAVASMLGLLDPARVEEILDIVALGDKDKLRAIINEMEIYEAEMIIDELIANLKDKFLRGDSKFSLLIYERFFRILAEAKSMLGISSDNGFVLGLMLFMMMEAQNLKSIDEAISEIRSQKSSPMLEINAAQSSQNLAAQPPKAQISQPVKQPVSDQNLDAKTLYSEFLAKIYDRNHELGVCFSKSVEFVSFSDDTLTLSTPSVGEDREKLVQNFKVINQIAKSVFGEATKISAQKREPHTAAPSMDNTQNLKPQEPSQSPKNPMSFLDDELKRMNIETNYAQTQPSQSQQPALQEEERKDEPQEVKKEFVAPINFNAQKSPQEQEKIRKEAILRQASDLFGEPQVIKA